HKLQIKSSEQQTCGRFLCVRVEEDVLPKKSSCVLVPSDVTGLRLGLRLQIDPDVEKPRDVRGAKLFSFT
ncbi:MAG: hypothetical protein ABGZ17_22590, partial [Planctomycetaceae bacterium]